MPNVEPDVVIRIRDLVVGFGNQIVLDALALDVRRGEILAWLVHLAEANQFCFGRSSA